VFLAGVLQEGCEEETGTLRVAGNRANSDFGSRESLEM